MPAPSDERIEEQLDLCKAGADMPYKCPVCDGPAESVWSDGWGRVVECAKCGRTGIDYFPPEAFTGEAADASTK